jgi:hypothetical protein
MLSPSGHYVAKGFPVSRAAASQHLRRRWDEILAEPDNYPDYMPFTRAFHYAARATAHAAEDDIAGARKEQAIYRERVKLVPKDEFFGNNTAGAILGVVTHMLEGEMLIREGNLDEGFAELRAAVKDEDTLHYDEPPGWWNPVRHSRAARLMQASRFAEAEQVFRDDLARFSENGWSLFD